MKEWMIKHVLAWLAGITSGQWDAALEAVRVAALLLSKQSGEERKRYVMDTLRLSWPDLRSGVMNLLIEIAYHFAKKRGYLK